MCIFCTWSIIAGTQPYAILEKLLFDIKPAAVLVLCLSFVSMSHPFHCNLRLLFAGSSQYYTFKTSRSSVCFSSSNAKDHIISILFSKKVWTIVPLLRIPRNKQRLPSSSLSFSCNPKKAISVTASSNHSSRVPSTSRLPAVVCLLHGRFQPFWQDIVFSECIHCFNSVPQHLLFHHPFQNIHCSMRWRWLWINGINGRYVALVRTPSTNFYHSMSWEPSIWFPISDKNSTPCSNRMETNLVPTIPVLAFPRYCSSSCHHHHHLAFLFLYKMLIQFHLRSRWKGCPNPSI